jgi:hypothetical protein
MIIVQRLGLEFRFRGLGFRFGVRLPLHVRKPVKALDALRLNTAQYHACVQPRAMPTGTASRALSLIFKPELLHVIDTDLTWA